MAHQNHILQPIYSDRGQLLFAEVLSRFENEDTQAAILAAERDGSIVAVDLASLDFGMNAAVPVAINISARTIESALMSIGKRIRPGITIEITETYPHDLNKLRTLAFEVHARGGKIAIDDIGNGEFADLELVSRIAKITSADWLKITMDADREVLDLCSFLHKPFIVERIESRRDLERAVTSGCSGLQGWFFQKQEGTTWLRNCRMEPANQYFDGLAAAMGAA